MSDKDFRPIDPIVPQRDDYAARRPVVDHKTPKPGKTPSRPAAPGNGGGKLGGFWKLLLLLLVVAQAGTAFFAWQQSRLLADLGQRFDSLSSRIESTDESLNQSGAALGVKIKEHQQSLDEHWAEIKKLWGVAYDTNRKAIAANKTAIDDQAAAVSKAEKTAAAMQAKVDQANKSVESIRSSSLALAAQVEEQADRLQRLADNIGKLEKSIQQWQGTFNSRLADSDEAMRAMDAYRQQINQQLAQIRQQLGMP